MLKGASYEKNKHKTSRVLRTPVGKKKNFA